MKPFHSTLAALILAAACASAGAAPHEIAPPGYAQAHAQFIAGANGDTKARDGAIDAFKALAASLPGHPLLAVFEGAAVAMQGRDASMPWDKLKYAEKGANTIEKALAQLTAEHDEAMFGGAPESIEARLVAANTLLALPEFMNRRAMGKRALEAALTSPAYPAAPAVLRARVLMLAAHQAGRDRPADEAALLRKVVEAAPQSAQAKQASARLKELGQ